MNLRAKVQSLYEACFSAACVVWWPHAFSRFWPREEAPKSKAG